MAINKAYTRMDKINELASELKKELALYENHVGCDISYEYHLAVQSGDIDEFDNYEPMPDWLNEMYEHRDFIRDVIKKLAQMERHEEPTNK